MVVASLAAGLFAIVVTARGTCAEGITHWYVATDGDDRWSGTFERPDAGRSDGPKASLAGARDAIRRARAEGRVGAGPLTVHVRGGTYRLRDPLVFEPIDSGTADAPVVYEVPRRTARLQRRRRPLRGEDRGHALDDRRPRGEGPGLGLSPVVR
jgi:hypothetical protein